MNANNENMLKAWRVFRVILPLTYEQGLSYEEQLQRILAKVEELIENGFTDYDPIIAELTKELSDYVKKATADIRAETAARKAAVDSLNARITQETTDREAGDANVRQILADAVKVPQTGPLVRKYVLCGDGLMNGEQGDADSGHTDNGWGNAMQKSGLSVIAPLSLDLTSPDYEGQLDVASDPDPKTVTDVVLLGNLNGLAGEQVTSFITKARGKFPNATIRIGSLRAGVLTQLTDEQCDAAQAGGAEIVHLEALLAQNECKGTNRPDYLNSGVQAKYATKIAKAALDGFVVDTGTGKREDTAFGRKYTWLKYGKTNDEVVGLVVGRPSNIDDHTNDTIEPYFEGVRVTREKQNGYYSSAQINEVVVSGAKIQNQIGIFKPEDGTWKYSTEITDDRDALVGALGRRSLK